MKKIRTQLILRFVLLSLLTIAVGAVGTIGFRLFQSDMTETHEMGDAREVAFNLANVLNKQEAVFLNAILAIGDGPEITRLYDEVIELDELFHVYLGQLDSLIAGRAVYANYEYIRDIYINQSSPLCTKLMEAVLVGNTAECMSYLDQFSQYCNVLQESAEGIVETINLREEQLIEGALARGNALMVFLVGVTVISVAGAVFVGKRMSDRLSRPILQLADAADKLSIGDIQVRLDIKANNELGRLAESFRKMTAGILQQAELLRAVANGDYTVEVPLRSERDVANMAIRELVKSNGAALGEMGCTAQEVSAASEQIAQGAQSLASGAVEQAANIQEVSAILSKLEEKVSTNTNVTQDAHDYNIKAKSALENSIDSMRQLLTSMKSINDSAKSITKITKVIEDIAFQTNILSLNAAVEAARAGTYGKGFSVVSEEVRSLAAKSAEAAKETAALIENSAEKVAQGNRIVDLVNEQLQTCMESASSLSEIMENVAAVSVEQASEIAVIATQVEEITGVIQNNSATAEQSAAAAQEMSAQAQSLREIAGRFHLDDDMMRRQNDNAISLTPQERIIAANKAEAGFALIGNPV